MRAVVCRRLGTPDMLTVEDIEPPQPDPGQVRVKVEAAGLNFPDTLIIEGKYQLRPELPFSPGSEIAGTVDALGKGTTGFEIGAPVIGSVMFGGFAEQAVVNASTLLRRPTSMEPVTGACFTIAYGTSMHALTQRAKLQPGETLLVLGASGGVGLAAVEIGKAMGARVIAAASSDEKLEVARAAGADHLVSYTTGSLKEQVKELTRGKGVDVAYDPVGGDLLEEALRATGWEGRVLIVGFASGIIPQVPANLALLKGNALVGVHYGPFLKNFPEINRANFEQLFAWFEAGKLKPLVYRTFGISEVAEAMRLLTERKAVGKVVLTVAGEA